MKTLFLTVALFYAVPADASDLAMVAFERFNFEISASVSNADKVDSMATFLDTLSRLGSEPSSTSECVKGVFGKKSTSLCFPIIQARSGTGGID